VEPQPYQVQDQDFQVIRTDENRFGIDTLTPGALVFTMAVLENFQIDNLAQFHPPYTIEPDDLFAARGTILPILAREWKGNDVRPHWGATKPLLCCDGSGVVRRIYGRPGKFVSAPRYNDNTLWIDVQAEFRRADTYAHHDIEYYVGPIAPDSPVGSVARDDGDADSWVRVLIYGPASHPVITYGGDTIELDLDINSGVIVEISSYPWQRRVIDSEGFNWRAKVVGATKYLDQIKFAAGDEIDVSWTCGGATAATGLYFMWREAYNVI
jgi:predicted nucleotidyltransferase